MKNLSSNWVEWFDKKTNTIRKSIVIAPVATCDAPAQAEAQCLMYSNGEYGCFCCEHQGISASVESGHYTVFLYPEDENGDIVEPVEPIKFRTTQ